MSSSQSPLDQIRIASPCDVDWASMTGDERKRHCGECKLDVYDFGAMSRSEAEDVLAGAQGRLCARFARRPDGTVVTRDCGPVRRRIARRMRRLRAAAAAALAFVSTFALSACGRGDAEPAPKPDTKEAPIPLPDPEPFMGIVCPEPPEAMGEVVVPPREMGRVALPVPKPDAPEDGSK